MVQQLLCWSGGRRSGDVSIAGRLTASCRLRPVAIAGCVAIHATYDGPTRRFTASGHGIPRGVRSAHINVRYFVFVATDKSPANPPRPPAFPETPVRHFANKCRTMTVASPGWHWRRIVDDDEARNIGR